MEAVLINLANNARDAMPQGGVLTIETRTANEIPGASGAHTLAGSYVHVLVTDTGHGMDAGTQEHLFEPFFTTKQKGKGTGLGLSSVYGGVEQNGGRIFVTSEVGKGTTFSIYFPRFERVYSSEPPLSPVSHRSRGGAETILLVEDEIAVRHMLREALSAAGYRVWEAANGAEALEEWGERVDDIHLLVTDVIMPVMNGVALADELKDRSSKLSVILMSGHADDLISSHGVRNRAFDFLPKPFLPDVLVNRVQQVLNQAAK
jgi:CheY-like chemotaxis protein